MVRGSTQEIQLALTSNVLSAGTLSSWSTQVLHRTNLLERFDAEPEKTLGELRQLLTQRVGEERLRDRLFALASCHSFTRSNPVTANTISRRPFMRSHFFFPMMAAKESILSIPGVGGRLTFTIVGLPAD